VFSGDEAVPKEEEVGTVFGSPTECSIRDFEELPAPPSFDTIEPENLVEDETGNIENVEVSLVAALPVTSEDEPVESCTGDQNKLVDSLLLASTYYVVKVSCINLD